MSRLLVLLALALGGCVFPYAVPGLRTEVGDSWSGPRAGQTRFAIGAHLASSVTPSSNPLTHIELGGGMLVEGGNDQATAAAAREAPSTAREEPLVGGYIDAGYAIVQNSFGRIIVGIRGEKRATRITDLHSTVLKLRIDAEVFKRVEGTFSGSGHCGATSGVMAGMTALGLYAESGPAIYDDGHEWVATMGFTARIPTIVGIAFGIPGCR